MIPDYCCPVCGKPMIFKVSPISIYDESWLSFSFEGCGHVYTFKNIYGPVTSDMFGKIAWDLVQCVLEENRDRLTYPEQQV